MKAWQQFGLKVAGAAALALAAQGVMEMFLGGAVPYVVPGILVACAAYLALLDKTPVPNGQFLKRGVSLLFLAFAVWLAVPQSQGGVIDFQPYAPELVDAARNGKKPVLIDFRASWCGPCKLLERNVFSRARVAKAAEEFLALRVDLTQPDEPARKVAEQFQVNELPTVIFLDADGHERRNLRLIGYERAEDFLQRLQQAR